MDAGPSTFKTVIGCSMAISVLMEHVRNTGTQDITHVPHISHFILHKTTTFCHYLTPIEYIECIECSNAPLLTLCGNRIVRRSEKLRKFPGGFQWIKSAIKIDGSDPWTQATNTSYRTPPFTPEIRIARKSTFSARHHSFIYTRNLFTLFLTSQSGSQRMVIRTSA